MAVILALLGYHGTFVAPQTARSIVHRSPVEEYISLRPFCFASDLRSSLSCHGICLIDPDLEVVSLIRKPIVNSHVISLDQLLLQQQDYSRTLPVGSNDSRSTLSRWAFHRSGRPSSGRASVTIHRNPASMSIGSTITTTQSRLWTSQTKMLRITSMQSTILITTSFHLKTADRGDTLHRHLESTAQPRRSNTRSRVSGRAHQQGSSPANNQMVSSTRTARSDEASGVASRRSPLQHQQSNILL
jgi:hypothetical protein